MKSVGREKEQRPEYTSLFGLEIWVLLTEGFVNRFGRIVGSGSKGQHNTSQRLAHILSGFISNTVDRLKTSDGCFFIFVFFQGHKNATVFSGLKNPNKKAFSTSIKNKLFIYYKKTRIYLNVNNALSKM